MTNNQDSNISMMEGMPDLYGASSLTGVGLGKKGKKKRPKSPMEGELRRRATERGRVGGVAPYDPMSLRGESTYA